MEDLRKNKKSMERAKLAREVAGGIETANVSGAVTVSETPSVEEGAAGTQSEEATATKASSKKASKKRRKEEDEAPKATTLFAEMNEKRSYEAGQRQAKLQEEMKKSQAQRAQYGPAPGQPLRQNTASSASSSPYGQAPVQQRPAQQRPMGQPPMQQRPMGQPPMQQRPGMPQGGNWVNRVNPGNAYGQQMNRPNQNMPGNQNPNQMKTWTRK